MTSLRPVVLVLAASLVLAAPAAAQNTLIELSGPAAQSFTVSAGKPATAARSKVTLPPVQVTVKGSTATVRHGGTLTLRAGRRALKLSAVQVTVGKRSRLSANVGGVRRTVATITAPSTRRGVDPAGTYLTEAPLRLTAAFAKRLGVKPGRLGRIDLEAAATQEAAPNIPGAPSAPTVTGPPTPGGATTATRPAAAATITGGTVRWAPRPSWLNYLASSGEANGVSAQAPATYDPDTLTYTFPITGGWFDAATGGAVIDTAGATDFRWSNHSLDLSFADWTFDFASATPKAVITVRRASGSPKKTIGTRQPVALVRLNGVAPTISGSTVTWTDVPMSLAAEGVGLYRAYLYNSPQGKVTISATLG